MAPSGMPFTRHTTSRRGSRLPPVRMANSSVATYEFRVGSTESTIVMSMVGSSGAGLYSKPSRRTDSIWRSESMLRTCAASSRGVLVDSFFRVELEDGIHEQRLDDGLIHSGRAAELVHFTTRGHLPAGLPQHVEHLKLDVLLSSVHRRGHVRTGSGPGVSRTPAMSSSTRATRSLARLSVARFSAIAMARKTSKRCTMVCCTARGGTGTTSALTCVLLMLARLVVRFADSKQ